MSKVIKLPIGKGKKKEKDFKVNLFIGTPAYNGMVHIDYLNSIMEYHKAGIPITTMTIGNESLITRGRNTIISYFHKLKQFTHLLFLDADMYLSAEGLMRLLSHQTDVIGAPVALKGFDKDGRAVYNVGKILKEQEGLAKVDKVGTAVFMLSRNAVDALIANAEDKGLVYGSNPYTRGTTEKDILMYDVFQVGVFNGDYLSEDYFVCENLRALGYNIYVDFNVKNRHNGMYVFR